MRRIFAAASILVLCAGAALRAEFSNRYPKVAGYNHHIYLEGYDLPILAAGPTDPAPSPDGRSLVVAARGWLWQVDPTTRAARRLTRGSGMDSRPAFSPDGSRLAFVRDDGKDLRIMGLDLASKVESVLVDTPAIELDPAFSHDGRSLFYVSGEAGDLDLWRLDLTSASRTRLTTDAGIELKPQPLPGDAAVVHVTKQRGGADTISILDVSPGKKQVLREEWIASQLRPALAPDGRSLAATVPVGEDFRLMLLDIRGGAAIQVAHESPLPIQPAWSPDGAFIYFAEADARQRFRLKRTRAGGGASQDLTPLSWDWGEPTSRVTIETRLRGRAEPLAARLAVVDRDGHPAIPDEGQARFDSQNGIVYFYSEGRITLEMLLGEGRVTATHGLAAPPVSARGPGTADGIVALELNPLWNAQAEGWYSGDHHWHLNYGGPYRLVPEDVLSLLQAEGLDVATPQVANLHTRFSDASLWSYRRLSAGPPLMAFAQEVRSHFLGHLGLVGASTLYWPWYWGPGYPVYGADDRSNAEALAHARREGGLGLYVHPLGSRDPFPANEPPSGLPLALVPDAVLGDLDALEVACLWSDELGTSDAWYRLLNLGLPVAPTGGTDAMPNLYRMMAVGATRVYAKLDGPLDMTRYLAAVRAGRSFVTNAPLVRFTVRGVAPGGVVAASAGSAAEWEMAVASAIPVEKAEIVVNGEVVWSDAGLAAPGEKICRGRTKAPRGGWIAARVHGGATSWPAMDSYPFAHTAPVWFGEVGSREPAAARAAAKDLLRWMDVADKALADGYGDAPIPILKARFAQARRKLEGLAR